MTVTDFHSHILPSTDHGCKNIEECVRQLKLMSACGTEIAVATPHFYPHVHRVNRFTETVDNAVEEIRRSDLHLPMSLALGAEILLCDGLNEMDGLDKLCIRGTKVLLLELPLKPLTQTAYNTVDDIMSDGYTVVLAHIDRYLKSFAQGVDDLIALGAYAQINASSLSSCHMRKKLFKYIENGNTVRAIGSDLHGSSKKDYKQFRKAQKLLGEDLEKIMDRTDKLLADAETIDLR